MFAGSLDVPDYPHGKLRLIKPSLDFAPVSLEWLRDPEVGRYMGADFSDVSIATEEQRIRDIQGGESTFGWMIEMDGEVIGAIEINQVEELSSEYMTKAGGLSIRSWRTLERLEFAFQRFRSDTFNGRTITWRVYTMTRTQWQNSRGAR